MKIFVLVSFLLSSKGDIVKYPLYSKKECIEYKKIHLQKNPKDKVKCLEMTYD